MKSKGNKYKTWIYKTYTYKMVVKTVAMLSLKKHKLVSGSISKHDKKYQNYIALTLINDPMTINHFNWKGSFTFVMWV